MDIKLYYGTNRNFEGGTRWAPREYGTHFSADGSENLRFGALTLTANTQAVAQMLSSVRTDDQACHGEELVEILTTAAEGAVIEAFEETLDRNLPEAAQPNAKLGSARFFDELKQQMDAGKDVVIFIHGFNTSWASAVGTAAALQITLNNWKGLEPDYTKEVAVVLFSWPSDGTAVPWTSYRSDRTDAEASGRAIGRGLLKFRDFLVALQGQVLRQEAQACGSKVHLLCHSMGNFVLQSALPRVADYSPGSAMPRLLDNVFLCAADVDDDVLEPGEPMARLDELCDFVSVYTNRDDRALVVSDWTKGNPDRLGAKGPAHLSLLHEKIETIDCTAVVHGAVQHSYYLDGLANRDIYQSILDLRPTDIRRNRTEMSRANFCLRREK